MVLGLEVDRIKMNNAECGFPRCPIFQPTSPPAPVAGHCEYRLMKLTENPPMIARKMPIERGVPYTHARATPGRRRYDGANEARC